MNDIRSSDLTQLSSEGTRVYEFSDFVPLTSGDVFVQVRHQRTIFHADGRIRNELVGRKLLLEHMVQAFRGKAFHSTGTLNAFFDDVEQAKSCAKAIILHHGIEPELCGTQLAIPVTSED